MRILRISGKNLASLAGEFTVDFEAEPLASSGLFAISGPTGAGKSTLLDALCLALYGATPRLLKRAGSQLPDVGGDTVSALDPRTLLRRGMAEAWAEVDFVGSDDGRYRARWSVRRAYNKPGGALQPARITLHRLPELAPLGGTNTEVAIEIVARIGLSFEQFTRAVLLAQNEFSAFLKTDENERGELLETLTGTTIYTDISRRAFERYKLEQSRTQLLQAKLANQAPLSAEQRTELDTERTNAELAQAALDARHGALEQQLRWHQEHAALARSEADAETALLAANGARDEATERRQRLATLEAVQPARALVADVARLESERKAAIAASARHDAELAGALESRRRAGQELDAAMTRLDGAEEALRAAAPQLDAAKALDASLRALAPAHEQAHAGLAAARNSVREARTAHEAKAAELARAQRSRDAALAWLTAQARLEPLASQWQRWERQLTQAEQAADALAAGTAALTSARSAAEQAAGRAAQAAAALTGAIEQVEALDVKRRSAMAAFDAFDGEAIGNARQALETRREQLATAERTWLDLSAAAEALANVGREQARMEAARGAAQDSLDKASSEAPALEAAQTQAERSLAAAELACAASVEQLRANLIDDAPCPVCGAAEHPYAHQDDRLHAMLATLRAQVDACRLQVRANGAQQASANAALSAARERLDALAQERDTLAQRSATLSRNWEADTLAQESPAQESPMPQARAEWFGAQRALLRDAFDAQAAQEAAWRTAAGARDAAQRDADAAQAVLARLRQDADTERDASARLHNELQSHTVRLETVATQLDHLLLELDPALAAAHGDGWQSAWRHDPPGWRAARAAEAADWQAQSALQTRAATAAMTLETEVTAALARSTDLDQTLASADAEFGRLDAALTHMRGERAALWEGRVTGDIERGLNGAVLAARDALTARQSAANEAAQLETRARTALAQLAERIAELDNAGASAATALADWLDDYRRHADRLDPVDDSAELARLLQVGAAWLAGERSALSALDAASATASAVLGERRAQRAAHLAAKPGQAQPPDEVSALFDVVQRERQAAHDATSALRLRTLQDDERRRHAEASLAEIEAQQAVEQRWGKLSELIGSSDGKKFRNYAQQFTLDVLLGYANAHLGQLAKRYRLERVSYQGMPSLALMVRDQDMGGEVRSVNSLSGGESFLVSLALALGLASLSSNRVRVESLFIDEGFGSLDSETLGVAMDALDALQSMGRKVGVISHVQEMTERIATRVLVRPAGGGSSAVVVE